MNRLVTEENEYVFAVDISLEEVDGIMAKIKAQLPVVVALLVEPAGELISSTAGSAALDGACSNSNGSGSCGRTFGNESADVDVRQTYIQVAGRFQGNISAAGAAGFSGTVGLGENDGADFVSSRLLSGLGLDWTLVVALPQIVFFQMYYINNNQTIIIVILLLAVAACTFRGKGESCL